MSDYAVVVLSGGQDSTTCLFWALSRFKNIHAVTFDYGQRNSREIDAARKVAAMAGAAHEVIEVGGVLRSMSPLTEPDVALEQYESYEDMERIIGDRVELTFVPMRNALFLAIAVNRAACLGTTHVVAGVRQRDNPNYPDCTRAFVNSMSDMVGEALGLPETDLFSIWTPLMDLSKAESVRLAVELPGAYAALAWTHTSYENTASPTGMDRATVLRAHGFEEAGVPDPLVLRANAEGLMQLPSTPNYSADLVEFYKAHAALN